MGDANTLGQSVRQAVRMLKGIHEDVFTLITSLDGPMADAGWYPFTDQRGKISGDLSASLERDAWLVQSIYRMYAPRRAGEASDRIAAFQVEFDPPDPLDVPTCLAVASRFTSPVRFKTVWDEWCQSGTQQVPRYLAGKPTSEQLPEAVLQHDFMPSATAGWAFAVPLCDLSGIEVLKERVSGPLIHLAAKL
jgi:hypothetical protein